MPTTSLYHREYLVRLPLPLAQLYSRAHNAKDGRGRHDNCFYLFEALIKLACCPLIAAYLDEVRRGGQRVEKLDRLLQQLALPSLGQWVGMLRELSRYFGERADAATHPLGHVWEQLSTKRRDLPGALALYRRIKNGPDGAPAGDTSVSILQLLDSLVQYRNTVFGHGAGRIESFYEAEMGPLLFPAVNDVLGEGVFDFLGAKGSRLVCLTNIRTIDEQKTEVALRELVGLQGERASPLNLDREQAAGLLPDRVAILWPGRTKPLRLDPLLVYRESELAEELLFLNRDRSGKQVEYLSYSTGRTERDAAMAPAMARFMSDVVGSAVTEDRLGQLQQHSVAESPVGGSRSGAANPERDRTARTLGDFEIVAELGRGGMGVVYLARQLSLGRLVALKMLPATLADDEVALGRFQREVRALARCEHPHIVKVLFNGQMPDGELYYAMEYISGADLEHVWRELATTHQAASTASVGGTTWNAAVLSASGNRRRQTVERTKANRQQETKAGASVAGASRPSTAAGSRSHGGDEDAQQKLITDALPPLPQLAANDEDSRGYGQRVAAILRDVALAVQSIHDQNIIHRDIKPANLMLTADGSRVVLMDFGLAKVQGMSLAASRSAGFLGTLRYAAPEQLATASLPVGPQADVRAIGVTLWELLTRQRLFGEAEDERQLTSWVLTHDVPRLRTIDATIDADLEAIVAKATERSAEDRIQSARQLAEYLDLYLQGKPVPLRNLSTAETIRRAIFRETRFAETMTKWSRVFIAYAVFFFLLGLVANTFVWMGNKLPWSGPTFAVWALGIVLIAWIGRFRNGGPLIYVERQAAKLWALFMAGLCIAALLNKIVTRDLGIDDGYRVFMPMMAVFSGVAFGCTAMLLGGSFHLPGIVCIVTAALMVAFPSIAPLLFGTMFSACLLLTGVKYLRRT